MLVKRAPDIYDKLSLLTNGAKFDVSCSPSFDRKNFYKKRKVSQSSEYIIYGHLMEDVYRFLKYYLQIFV